MIIDSVKIYLQIQTKAGLKWVADTRAEMDVKKEQIRVREKIPRARAHLISIGPLETAEIVNRHIRANVRARR